jgi:hypothetical protein
MTTAKDVQQSSETELLLQTSVHFSTQYEVTRQTQCNLQFPLLFHAVIMSPPIQNYQVILAL